MRSADKSGAAFAFIIGEEELARKVVGVKNLRAESPQTEIEFEALPVRLRKFADRIQRGENLRF